MSSQRAGESFHVPVRVGFQGRGLTARRNLGALVV